MKQQQALTMSPQRTNLIFWTAVLAHAALWTALPGIFHSAYRPDVIEQLFIGREWVLASSRHPALPAWMLEITNVLFGRPFWSPFFVSQFCAVLTFWSIWRTSKRVFNPQLALVPPLTLLLYWLFTIEAVKYNQNLPYIAFWTLSITFTFDALRTGKTRYWLLTGLCLGLCLASKFSAILLVAAIVLYFVFDSKARKTWRQSGPYLSAGTAFVVFLPVLSAVLCQDHIVAPEYIAHPDPIPLFKRLYNTGEFSLTQFGVLALPLAGVLPFLRLPLKKNTERTEEQQEGLRFLGAMIFVPFLMHVLAGLTIMEMMNVDYGAPLWTMLTVWILLYFQQRDSDSGKRSGMYFGTFLIVTEIVLAAAFLVQSCYSPYFMNTPRRFHFPMQELGAKCTEIWSEHSSGECPYLSGEWWLAGNAAEGMRSLPSVHAIGGYSSMDIEDTPTSWSLDSDVNEKGGIILWTPAFYENGEPLTLRKHFPEAEILEPFEIPYSAFPHLTPVKIRAAVVAPK